MSLRGNSIRTVLTVVALMSVLLWAWSCGQESGVEDATPEEVAADVPTLETVDPIPGDPDGDGFDTQTELAYGTDPNNAGSHPPDLDGDKLPDPEDEDLDGDDVANDDDAFPYDPDESVDTDGDGVGDNGDGDDDNDGYSDELEGEYGTDPLNGAEAPADLDGDGTPDDADSDVDGDGMANADDAFPENAMEWTDTDGDGTGDNSDEDDDGDGYSDDLEEKYGTDAYDQDVHPEDLDEDGLPDAEDLDMDGDGVDNTKDAFPADASESADSDGDGEGNNVDADDDNDGYPDLMEEKYGSDPSAASSTPADLDGDLLPDEEDSDVDGDGALNEDDAFPEDAAEDTDTDEDGVGDNADNDDDGDGYPDALEEAAGTNPKDGEDKPGDLDGDGIPDEDDIDKDGDDVLNDADAFPLDATEWSDFDGDGAGDNADEDDDNDGYPDSVEEDLGFNPKNDADHPADMDGDGTPDDQDADIDGDGVDNGDDVFPYDPDESVDTDEDGVGDNGDKDDDNDGFTDEQETALDTDPLDAESAPDDQDGDLIPDALDDDQDGDSVLNDFDAFPADPTESVDTDADGTGDNADTDDDDDGYSDEVEAELGTDPLDPSVHPVDLDGDGIPDPSDWDVDGDDVGNAEDAFPLDPDEAVDTDDDGIGDNADDDDDGDGYPDDVEEDAGTDSKDPESHPDDLDGDGIADSADPDIDGDGVGNADDAFPQDPDEWFDIDGDGVGNNADLDDDGDGFSDEQELLFQTDPTSPFSYPADLDGDKIPDAVDDDRDGDGVDNAADAFPNNPAEWLDTDGDGIGNNVDLDDDGDGFSDVDEAQLGFDPLDFADHPGDLDGDGIPDISDLDMDGDGVENGLDAFPLNPIEWEDNDGDGVGDNTDLDDDADGYPDAMELAYASDPLDPFSFPADLDGDKIPDLEDEDMDGDLVKNDLDAFPGDVNEWFDTDGDGIGNNADLDDDGDGYFDAVELQYMSDPVDASSTPPDIDGDLIPDPEDMDMDGDGVLNIDDAFPEDPDAWEEIMDESSFGGDYQDTIPPDADPDAFDTKKFSLVRGQVWDQDGVAFEGATMTVLDRPEYGSVETDANGWYTIPVNGGLTLTLVAHYEGFSEVQRKVDVPWNDMIVVEPVELVPYDPIGSEVFMSGDEEEVIVHTNTAAEHPITVAFTGDNLAVVEDAEGNLELTDFLTITATEYENPDQMPGILPNTSEFTYCVDVKAEGYDHVEFDQPVMLWTKDFLGFAVGDLVPTGFYDRTDGKWKPMGDGLVVELLDLDDDTIIDALDGDGDGVADDLDQDGDYADEVIGIDLELDAMPGDVYWRVAVDHFSPIDMNWPASGPPEDAEPPPDIWDYIEDLDKRRKCFGGGYSEINIRGRIMHEDIGIPGTDFALHYSTEWVPGFSMPISIPASGPTVPGSLSEIIVNWSIAGRSYSEILPALPNQTVDWLWDGEDFMGNLVNQRITLTTEIGFKYPASYYSSRASAESVGANFAAMGVEATGINAFRPVTLWRKNKRPIFRLRPETPANAWSVGVGWTPSTYHYYDGSSQSVLMGDGQQLRGDQFGVAINTVDTGILPYEIRAIDVDSDGVIYILPKGNPLVERQVIKIAPAKDPEPEVYVSMQNRIGDMAVGPDDNVYLTIGSYLWKVPRKTGNPVLMANLYLQFFNCFAYFGDYCLLNVDVDEFGYAFLVSRYPAAFGTSSMAIVAPDGTVLANPVDLQCTAFDMAVGPDGLMAAACKNGPVKKIDRNGTVESYPGWAPNCIEFFGYTDPAGITFLRDGSILVADEKCNRIRKILPEGVVTTLAGNGISEYSGDGEGPLSAGLDSPTDVVMGPDDAIYVADAGNNVVRAIAEVESAISLEEGQYGVPLETGEILIFGEKMEHLEARDMMTGIAVRQFVHDELGVLQKEVNPSGREIEFISDAQGKITSIIGYNGEETQLAYDQMGYLVSIIYPDGAEYLFDYHDNGLIKTKTTPMGGEFEYTYDETGRIIKAEDPRGGHTSYLSENLPEMAFSKTTTAEGKVTQYVDSSDDDGNQSSTMTNALGGEKLFTASSDGWEQLQVEPSGESAESLFGVDPKYDTRFVRENTMQTPSGLTSTTVSTRAYDDQQGLATYVNSTNGKATTTLYDTLAGVLTVTTPLGRVTEQVLDTDRGLLMEQSVGEILPMTYEHDEQGRTVKFVQGDRETSFAYDDANRTIIITDPMGNETESKFDEAGKLLWELRSDGSQWSFEYDSDGNLKSIIAPDGRLFDTKTDAVGLTEWISTPAGNTHSMSYNLDREQTGATYPSGETMQNELYKGLLMERNVAGEVSTFEYMDDGTGRLASATSADGVVTKLSYDGSAITQLQYVSPFPAAVDYVYNDDMLVDQISVAGATLQYEHDAEGMLSEVSGFNVDRVGSTTAVTSVSDGVLQLDYTYSEYGELDSMTWTVGGVVLYEVEVDHRADGRFSTKSEDIEAEHHDYAYEYDVLGRVKSVTLDGDKDEIYAYDEVTNRTSAKSPALGPIAVTAEFDDDDRLLSQGTWSAEYDSNGFAELVENSLTGESYEFDYTADGKLKSLVTPDGVSVEYLYDASGLRVARKVNGVQDRAYIYNSPEALLAVLDGSGQLDTLFIYVDLPVPIAMIQGGVTYYLIHDINLSVRLVVDQQGNVVQRLDYDAYGNMLYMEKPDFESFFTFATGTEEFGVIKGGLRDYFAPFGRWLAKDPIAPESTFNQYAYAAGDPVNHIDPTGLWEIGGYFYKLLGGGLSVGYKNGHVWLKGCAGAGLGAGATFDPTGGPPKTLSQKGYDGWNHVDAGLSARIPIVGGIGVGTTIPQSAFTDPCADIGIKGGVDIAGLKVFEVGGKYSRAQGYRPGKLNGGSWPPGKFTLRRGIWQDIASKSLKKSTKFGVRGRVSYCGTNVWRLW